MRAKKTSNQIQLMNPVAAIGLVDKNCRDAAGSRVEDRVILLCMPCYDGCYRCMQVGPPDKVGQWFVGAYEVKRGQSQVIVYSQMYAGEYKRPRRANQEQVP